MRALFLQFSAALLWTLFLAAPPSWAAEDGSRHHGVGIQATVPVPRTLEGIRAGRDELLEKAIEVVGGTP